MLYLYFALGPFHIISYLEVIIATFHLQDEPAFGDSIEFLVDEVDRFSLEKESKTQIEIDGDSNDTNTAKHTIRIHRLLSEDEVSYGQRQCPRGVHNPHGEESEMLYYIDQQLIDEFQIDMELKPELETLW